MVLGRFEMAVCGHSVKWEMFSVPRTNLIIVSLTLMSPSRVWARQRAVTLARSH